MRSHHHSSPYSGPHEWEAFLALTPILSETVFPIFFYDRLLRAAHRTQADFATWNALILEAGLSFFEESLDIELALMRLMRLIREGILEPVRDRPFTFLVCRSGAVWPDGLSPDTRQQDTRVPDAVDPRGLRPGRPTIF
ncbi:MAG: hypothetical protein ACRD06_04615 [Terriglobia bacterium]